MIGDSKTNISNNSWGETLRANISTATGTTWTALVDGFDGATVANWRTVIDAHIASANITPAHVLINLGVNDFNAGLPNQTTWQNDYIWLIDRMHYYWPHALIHITTPWKLNFDASSDTLAGWIQNVITARSTFTVPLDDERVWFKPNHATYSSDGVHYFLPAGQTAGAAAKQSAMGY